MTTKKAETICNIVALTWFILGGTSLYCAIRCAMHFPSWGYYWTMSLTFLAAETLRIMTSIYIFPKTSYGLAIAAREAEENDEESS